MMINRRVHVVVTFADGRAALRCVGPDANGGCPHPAEDGGAACAGGRILPLQGTAADGAQLEVSCAAQRCPLAHIVRSVPAPWD